MKLYLKTIKIKALLFALIILCPQILATAFALPNNMITNRSTLSEQELKKCELNGIHKKNWTQRLQWFENRIINNYQKMSKKNILVVGSRDFLVAFKATAKKYN